MLYSGRHSRITAWDDKHVVVRRLMFIRTSLRVWPMWQVVSAFSSAAGRQRCRPPSAEPRMVMREGGPRVPIEPVGDKKTIDPTPASQWHFQARPDFYSNRRPSMYGPPIPLLHISQHALRAFDLSLLQRFLFRPKEKKKICPG